MKAQINVRDAVRTLLEQVQAENREIPSIRTIRAQIGGCGSMQTIAETVKQWRCENLQSSGSLPTGFEQQDADQIIQTIWQSILPIMQRQVEGIQKAADDRIALERSEAAKLTDAANEVFAEGQRKDEAIAQGQVREQKLRDALAHDRGALQEAQETITQLRQEVQQLRLQLDKANQIASEERARADTIRKLVPFLDPKHLPASTPQRR